MWFFVAVRWFRLRTAIFVFTFFTLGHFNLCVLILHLPVLHFQHLRINHFVYWLNSTTTAYNTLPKCELKSWETHPAPIYLIVDLTLTACGCTNTNSLPLRVIVINSGIVTMFYDGTLIITRTMRKTRTNVKHLLNNAFVNTHYLNPHKSSH